MFGQKSDLVKNYIYTRRVFNCKTFWISLSQVSEVPVHRRCSPAKIGPSFQVWHARTTFFASLARFPSRFLCPSRIGEFVCQTVSLFSIKRLWQLPSNRLSWYFFLFSPLEVIIIIPLFCKFPSIPPSTTGVRRMESESQVSLAKVEMNCCDSESEGSVLVCKYDSVELCTCTVIIILLLSRSIKTVSSYILLPHLRAGLKCP